MPAKKNRQLKKDSPKGLLIGCIVAIVILTFLAGYLSGKIYNEPDEAPLNDSNAPLELLATGQDPTLLDPDKVIKETEPPLSGEDSFTFHNKLDKETVPATEPLPKAKASPEPPVVKPAPAKAIKKPEVQEKSVEKQPAEPVKETQKVVKKKPVVKEPVKTGKRIAEPKPKQTKEKRYSIQIGSYKTLQEAEEMARKLNQDSLGAYITQADVKGAIWNRVRVGTHESRSQALQTANMLETKYNLPTLLVIDNR